MGEPESPVKVLGPYKSVIRALVRDFIPLKYRKWNRKEDNLWRVPESDKDAIWEKVKGYFTFPSGIDEQTVKEHAKHIMRHAFKTFKGDMNKLVEAGIQPNFDIEYTKPRDFRKEFKAYKLSDEALAASARNKANLLKATDHHRLGS